MVSGVGCVVVTPSLMVLLIFSMGLSKSYLVITHRANYRLGKLFGKIILGNKYVYFNTRYNLYC
jgi:hypothetical protein